MKSKDQQLLEEAYQRVLEGDMGPVREESPEGTAIQDAMMAGPEAREKAKAGIVGKYVTIYKRERSQSFANKEQLTRAEVKGGERLHSTSEVVGSTPVASGIVKDLLWQDMRTNQDVRLVLDTDDDESEERTKEITVPFTFRNFLVVRKPFKQTTQQKVGGPGLHRPGMY
jgi:hypothetical protein